MEYIINWLKENLSDERFRHSIGTRDAAEKLAIMFGLDSQKAALAGLLHECAKEYSYEDMLEIISEHCPDVDEEELKAKKVLHAPVSAYVAKTIFDVQDAEILDAIRFHTIGRIGMTDFEKVIFLADKIELNTRIEENFEALRKELDTTKSLDATLFLCSKMTIQSLLDRNLIINNKTIELYNNLLN